MADFDAFTSSEPQTQEEDPAADFLAREQDQLAGLEDDNFTGGDAFGAQTSSAPTAAGYDFMADYEQELAADGLASAPTDTPTEGAGAETASPPPSNPFLAMGADTPAQDDVTSGQDDVTSGQDDILAQFDSPPAQEPTNDFLGGGFGGDAAGYDMLGGSSAAPAAMPPSLDIFDAPEAGGAEPAFGGAAQEGGQIPGLDDLDQRLDEEESAPSDPYASVRSVDQQMGEPEKIKLWREEQQLVLQKKDAEEAEAMEEWREAAKKQLDDWYRHRSEQFEKTKANNREGEAEFIKERDESVPGHEWERICRLCEFNPKSNRSQRDVSRMRSILLQLKQNPIDTKAA